MNYELTYQSKLNPYVKLTIFVIATSEKEAKSKGRLAIDTKRYDFISIIKF